MVDTGSPQSAEEDYTPSAEEEAVFEWVEQQMDLALGRVNQLEERLAFHDPRRSDASWDDDGVTAALADWLASGPEELLPGDYEEWRQGVVDEEVWEEWDGQPPSVEEVIDAYERWSYALAFALHREADRREKALSSPSWFEDETQRCRAETRFWKSTLKQMVDGEGGIPDLPVPESPHVECALRRGHPGAHTAYLGEDSTFERWFALWEDDQLLAENRFIAGTRCPWIDGNPMLHRPRQLRACSLPTGHPGPCRFDAAVEPLITDDDDIVSSDDWNRMSAQRLRATGPMASAVTGEAWWSEADTTTHWTDWPDPDAFDDEEEGSLTAEQMGRLDALADRLDDFDGVFTVDEDGDPFETNIAIRADATSVIRVMILERGFDISLDLTVEDGAISDTLATVPLDDLDLTEETIRDSIRNLSALKAKTIEQDAAMDYGVGVEFGFRFDT